MQIPAVAPSTGARASTCHQTAITLSSSDRPANPDRLMTRASNPKRPPMLSEQGCLLLRRFFNFDSDLVPNLFAFQIAIVSQLFCALSDLLVSIESVMCAAEIRIHYNGILTRNPHDNPRPDRVSLAGAKLDKQVDAGIMASKHVRLSIHMFI